ncbi:MAG: hypothetical protein IKH08_09580 [Prevotella sp.]|nr:hypothetical protein [Prevotella sp.]
MMLAQFPHAAYGDGDVRHCSLIYHAQFLARGIEHRDGLDVVLCRRLRRAQRRDEQQNSE